MYNRGLPITARNLFGRRREIQTFRRDWESEQIRVLSVVAYGGTGKSALVNAWLHEMQQRDYGGASKVLAWSFYSQGTKENLVSADLFVSTALGWLGDESPPSLNLWARGLRLAEVDQAGQVPARARRPGTVAVSDVVFPRRRSAHR